MKVRVAWGKRRKSKYRVNAPNLAAVEKALKSRTEAGEFAYSLKWKATHDAKGYVTSIVVEPSWKILMPVWPEYRTQPQRCKDEWDSMWRALERHEDGHRRIYREAVVQLTKQLEKLPRTRKEDLSTLVNQRIKELKEAQAKYDKKTEHGAARGVQLAITDDCR